MKTFFTLCALCCFIAILKLPITYYTFLRIIISLGAILAIYNFLKHKDHTWLIVFVILLILFNPVFPIYLYRKSAWAPFDILAGILFLLLAFVKKKVPEKTKTMEVLPVAKTYTRDRIIISKSLTNKEN